MSDLDIIDTACGFFSSLVDNFSNKHNLGHWVIKDAIKVLSKAKKGTLTAGSDYGIHDLIKLQSNHTLNFRLT